MNQPNILVVQTDDHAQWAASCYGNTELSTPSMDWLARTGVRIQNAFTPTPVCSPARASFWTGRLPSQHGIHDFLGPEFREGPWLDGERILPELLSEAGYSCALFGKWHCGRPEERWRGFEHWFCLGKRTGPHFGVQPYNLNGAPLELHGYQSTITTDHAIAWLRERKEAKRKPFFAYVGLVATHSPFSDHPERLVTAYRKKSFKDIPADALHPFGRRAGEGSRAAEDDWRERQAQYYAAVTEVDTQLGRLVDELEHLGQLENTLIVYTADHGLNMGHHGIFGKGNGTRPLNMLEESIRVPLLFGGWDRLHGQQLRLEMVDHTDLFLTLAEIAGAELPSDIRYPGRSYASVLTDGAPPQQAKRVQIGEYGNCRMARSQRYKLLRRNGGGPDEFYDLAADPRETRNLLAGSPSAAEAAALTFLDEALAETFRGLDDSPRSGPRVADLPRHNRTEAWREIPS
jgi:arylsulfatase A-like enzyme